MPDVLFENLKKELVDQSSSLAPLIEKKEERKYFCVFASFDIEDSTKFKVENPQKWATLFTGFYELAKKFFSEEFPGVKVWKYVGDEILFYIPITNKGIFKTFLEAFYKIHHLINDSLIILCGNCDCKQNLNCRSTFWIAPILDIGAGKRGISDEIKLEGIYQNIHTGLIMGNVTLEDFIGPDIDIGFRVTKVSHKNLVTISADLAYVIYRLSEDQEKLRENLNIVSYEKLKGVWKGNYYPVIWFHPRWKTEVLTSFSYAEYLENEAVNNIKMGKTDSIEKLEEVLIENGRKTLADEMVNLLSHLPDEPDHEVDTL